MWRRAICPLTIVLRPFIPYIYFGTMLNLRERPGCPLNISRLRIMYFSSRTSLQLELRKPRGWVVCSFVSKSYTHSSTLLIGILRQCMSRRAHTNPPFFEWLTTQYCTRPSDRRSSCVWHPRARACSEGLDLSLESF